MRRVTMWEKLAAVMVRDLLVATRYRAGFVLSLAGTLAEVAAFFFLAKAIGPSFRPEGIAFFPYLVVGSGFFTFLITGVQAFLSTVQEAQQTGTLEVLLTTSTPAPMLVFLSAFSAFTGKTIGLLIYMVLGLAVFGVPLTRPNLLGGAIILVLSLAVAMSLGILAAALQIAIQRGSAVTWALSSVWFLTGVAFPVTVLPQPLQWFSWLVPVTHSLNGMRMSLLAGQGLAVLAPEILWLAVASMLLLPISLLAFHWVLRRARQEGTLSFY